MNPMLQNLLIVSVMLGFAGMEWASRRYKNTVHASADDTKLELAMFLSLIAVAQPLAILVTGKLSAWLMPEQRDALANLPWWAMAGILLLVDDMTQYWWHRASHTPVAVAAAPRAPLGHLHEHPRDLPQQLVLLPADARPVVRRPGLVPGLRRGLRHLPDLQDHRSSWARTAPGAGTSRCTASVRCAR